MMATSPFSLKDTMLSQQLPTKLSMDFDCSPDRIRALFKSRIGSSPVQAELVHPKEVRAPQAYKRFNDTLKKENFRLQLIDALLSQWEARFGIEKASELKEAFLEIANRLDENGATIFASVITSENFQKLIDAYNEVLRTSGSKNWIHAFLNLANHPDFLTNTDYNAAFMHSLLIALVSYRVGGPVRMVDARAKDAEPISVLAQDNMLHIDNTPFNDEYKIILAWEKGKPSGPKGQNFVFLPGTQKGARQCMEGNEGPYSSENASIFTSLDSIEKVLSFQKSVLGRCSVVELTHETKPLTTLFAAGSLVHHRHRTEDGFSRSCIILAFHRAEDNPGQLLDSRHLEKTKAKTDPLFSALFGNQGMNAQKTFIDALTDKSDEMAELLSHLHANDAMVEEIVPTTCEIGEEELKKWKETCTNAPTVEEKKEKADIVPLGGTFEKTEFVHRIAQMMIYDKHGPLDLILYSDSHEEIRKWARNQIREKKIELLHEQLAQTWSDEVTPLCEEALLTPEALQAIGFELAAIAAKKHKEHGGAAVLPEGEKISSSDAYRSVRQLILDLRESIVRCEDKTAYLSTSLFMFWATDTLMRFEIAFDTKTKELGARLLRNYIATAILVAKAKRSEQTPNSELKPRQVLL